MRVAYKPLFSNSGDKGETILDKALTGYKVIEI